MHANEEVAVERMDFRRGVTCAPSYAIGEPESRSAGRRGSRATDTRRGAPQAFEGRRQRGGEGRQAGIGRHASRLHRAEGTATDSGAIKVTR
jgi:hypothetical protein